MPISLDSVMNTWYKDKQVDTNGDNKISREELGTYTNKAAQKPANEQSMDEALAGKLIHSADNNGGPSFFDLISKLDNEAGLSPKDMENLAAKSGNKNEIGGDDFQAFTTPQASDPKRPSNTSAEQPKTMTVKKGDSLWKIATNLKKENPDLANQSIPQIIKNLQTANGIKDPNKILAGQSLKLPGNTTKPAEAPKADKTANATPSGDAPKAANPAAPPQNNEADKTNTNPTQPTGLWDSIKAYGSDILSNGADKAKEAWNGIKSFASDAYNNLTGKKEDTDSSLPEGVMLI